MLGMESRGGMLRLGLLINLTKLVFTESKLEKLRQKSPYLLNKINFRCPLGVDVSEDVANENIKCKWIKLKPVSQMSKFIYYENR